MQTLFAHHKQILSGYQVRLLIISFRSTQASEKNITLSPLTSGVPDSGAVFLLWKLARRIVGETEDVKAFSYLFQHFWWPYNMLRHN